MDVSVPSARVPCIAPTPERASSLRQRAVAGREGDDQAADNDGEQRV